MKQNRAKALRYLVVLRKTSTGYCADVPDLPGCVAAAATIRSCRQLIAEAIALHLDLMREAGERLPAASQRMEFAIDEREEEEICTWVEVPDVATILRPMKKRLRRA
jgi:predicted RNase H-like HicB family nuclease